MTPRYYYVAIIVCVVFLVVLLAVYFTRHFVQKRRLRNQSARRDLEANQMVQQWRAVQEPQQTRPKYYKEPLTTYISTSSQSTNPSTWSYNSDTLPSYSHSDGFARPYYYYRQDEGTVSPAEMCHICQRQFNDTDAVKQVFGGLVHQQCYSLTS
ncbi:hypothetical protein LXG23DRAFT_54835 [Yarrowia lipolytica]|uniref:Uncharacterized protein n=1 Tax=Yarrowia lipolytica TaxID=4952 RepID=A0A1D8NAA7_YARLL|nr:hypothetical protein YALI1_C12317g [Yarrowia lipolytica]KAB8280136.1 hypothetical protein BKA91DRAFT_142462 [Yarrowia lipolytica]KAE8169071.1 hypothetical protein BKA90DRAFT_143229 [Yarrowia lipolytica]KAJ8053239.1 hypothetical protein LXG23DRAFT_54835 [Yarrowia lipolytica]RMI94405.1 hypothetical protein BD777DRAFT_131784 [Yarrowia lipolytica]